MVTTNTDTTTAIVKESSTDINTTGITTMVNETNPDINSSNNFVNKTLVVLVTVMGIVILLLCICVVLMFICRYKRDATIKSSRELNHVNVVDRYLKRSKSQSRVKTIVNNKSPSVDGAQTPRSIAGSTDLSTFSHGKIHYQNEHNGVVQAACGNNNNNDNDFEDVNRGQRSESETAENVAIDINKIKTTTNDDDDSDDLEQMYDEAKTGDMKTSKGNELQLSVLNVNDEDVSELHQKEGHPHGEKRNPELQDGELSTEISENNVDNQEGVSNVGEM